MIVPMTIEEFEKMLPKFFDRDTSIDPEGWNKENPFWGQSALVSLLAQSLFHGYVWGAILKGVRFEKMNLHFWNVFPDGTEKDFTCSQFGEEYPVMLDVEWVGVASFTVGKNVL